MTLGHIDRDTLRYHGSYPFSDWGKTWTRVFKHLPVDAAYSVYDQCVRKAGLIPVPPLQFVTAWENKCFRIVKTENNGTSVLALYKHDGDFFLITATLAAYEKWRDKKDASLIEKRNYPTYPTED